MSPGPPPQTTRAGPVTLRSIALTVYAPAVLFAVGQGAVIPIVALAARDVGASVPVAGLVVALRGIGTMAFDIPAGLLVARLGERRAMVAGTIVLVAALAGAVVAPNPAVLAVSMLVMGAGWSVWLLARLAYVTDVMPPRMRGRALSTLGGVNRIGIFAGPFAGAVAIATLGLRGAFMLHIATAILGLVVLVAARGPVVAEQPHGHAPVAFRQVTTEHARVFATAGVVTLCIGILRASRYAVVPLWADHIGLDAAAVSLIFGISAAMDMTLFYPAGSVSDRFGRKVVAIPCITILAAGFLLLPLSTGFTSMAAVGLVLGFGNGLGAGIVMTLGADLSPDRGRAEFLGVWRTVGDVGTSAGPLVVAGVAAIATLAASSVAVGLLGLAGAVVMTLAVPEPLHRHRKGDME